MSIQCLESVETIEEAIRSLLSVAKDSDQFTVLSVQINNDVPKHFLEKQEQYPLFFWKNRNNTTEYQAWGVSRTFENIDQAKQFSMLPSFICHPFSEKQNNTVFSAWANFPKKLIWQPVWLLEKNDKTTLFHIVSKNIFQTKLSTKEVEVPQCIPNQQNWIASLEKLQTDFQSQTMQKIVLAKQSQRHCSKPWSLFWEFVEAQPNCYQFLFSPNPSEIFFGSSPEKLFSIQNNILETEALAGTRKMSSDQKRNNELKNELQNSNKDNHEHDIVVDYIKTQLRPFASDISIKEKKLLELEFVQHLQTPISASLGTDISIEELFQKLHPTPAVCGLPKEKAMATIIETEPFSRGFYAGAIGIFSEKEIDFTVSIRSALWQNKRLLIWTGAGIVTESNPVEEWNELENKAFQFIKRTEP